MDVKVDGSEHRITITDGLARVVYVGPFNFEGWREAFERLVADEAFRPGMPCLWDLRESTAVQLSRRDLEAIGGHVRTRADTRGNGKTAMVASGDLEFGMGRMYEQLSEPHNPSKFCVFRDPDEAEAWLAE